MFGEKPLNLDRRWEKKIGKDQAKKRSKTFLLAW